MRFVRRDNLSRFRNRNRANGGSAFRYALNGMRARDGWHGTRQRWKLRKMDELTAINNTIKAIYG